MTVITIPIDTLAVISQQPTDAPTLRNRFGKRSSTIRSRLKSLQGMGLVDRRKYGRSYIYRVTEKGKKILEVFE